MSRIEACFGRLYATGRKALIPFIAAGDPHPDVTVTAMHALVEAGADLIELGVPFSDPMADGPAIQLAYERALAHHTALADVLEMVRRFRHSDNTTPVVLMSYLNPIELMGYESFATAAGAVGVDGVLTVDLPAEEAGALVNILRGQTIDPIFLIAPTTHEARIKRICALASGFIYYVSIKGITGAAHLSIDDVARHLGPIRALTRLPLGVGFGIKDAQAAAQIAEVADAVIVGSALVQRFEALIDQPECIPSRAAAFVGELRQAMDVPLAQGQGVPDTVRDA